MEDHQGKGHINVSRTQLVDGRNIPPESSQRTGVRRSIESRRGAAVAHSKVYALQLLVNGSFGSETSSWALASDFVGHCSWSRQRRMNGEN